MQSLFRIREDIVKVGQRLFISGMLPGGDGNISVRVDDRLIAITPTELSKGFLSPADIILVDRTGKILDGRFKPTSELPV
ncbi:MAG: class II aldolase/adducin family protein, partial [bacterium]